MRSGGTGRALFRAFLSKRSFDLSYFSFSLLRLSRVWCSYILELDLRIKPRLSWSTVIEEGFISDDADLLYFGDLRPYARFSVGIPVHVRHLGNSKSGKGL